MNYRTMKSYELRKLLGSLDAADRAEVLNILRERKMWAKKNKPGPKKKKKKKKLKRSPLNPVRDGRADMLRKSRRNTTQK